MAKTTSIYEQAERNYVMRTYNLTVNALASSGTQAITTVPAGFVVEYCRLDNPAMGADTGLAVGDAADDNRYNEDTDSSTAQDNNLILPTGQGYQNDADTAIILTNTGGSATTASDLTVSVTLGGWKASGGGIDLDI